MRDMKEQYILKNALEYSFNNKDILEKALKYPRDIPMENLNINTFNTKIDISEVLEYYYSKGCENVDFLKKIISWINEIFDVLHLPQIVFDEIIPPQPNPPQPELQSLKLQQKYTIQDLFDTQELSARKQIIIEWFEIDKNTITPIKNIPLKQLLNSVEKSVQEIESNLDKFPKYQERFKKCLSKISQKNLISCFKINPKNQDCCYVNSTNNFVQIIDSIINNMIVVIIDNLQRQSHDYDTLKNYKKLIEDINILLKNLGVYTIPIHIGDIANNYIGVSTDKDKRVYINTQVTPTNDFSKNGIIYDFESLPYMFEYMTLNPFTDELEEKDYIIRADCFVYVCRNK